MIQDMTHLEVLRKLGAELQECLVRYNARSNGVTDKTELLRLRLEQNAELKEIVRKQERHLRYMNGERIEPETHFIDAVIVGTGQADSAM